MEDNKDIINEEIKIEDVDYSNEDELKTNLTDEEIKALTDVEAQIVAQKIEIAIEKFENILVEAQDKGLSEEEIIELGFNEDEYFSLKELDKKIYKHMKLLRKKTKEGGFFGALPSWAFVLFIICAIFTIIPVNPYLPISIYSSLLDSFKSKFMLGIGGAYLIYFIYLGIFLITELVLLVILLIKGRKAKEKMQSFKAYLVLFIINVIIDIPGLIIFLNAALSYNA